MSAVTRFMEKVAGMELAKVVIASAIISGIYYFKFYDDGSANVVRITTLQAQIAEETAKKVKTDEALKEVERMKKAVVELGQKYQAIVRRLPAELNSLDVNRSIDGFSENAGVNVRSREPAIGAKNDIYIEDHVTIEAEGNYSQIAQFIYLVSKSERLAAIKEFRIERPTETAEDGPLKFQGTIINYKLAPDPKDAKDGTTTAGATTQ